MLMTLYENRYHGVNTLDAIFLLDAERLCYFYLFEDRKYVCPYHHHSSHSLRKNDSHAPKGHNG
jgi:hypothetical protein